MTLSHSDIEAIAAAVVRQMAVQHEVNADAQYLVQLVAEGRFDELRKITKGACK